MASIASTVQGTKEFLTQAALATGQTDASGATTANVVTVVTAGSNGSYVTSVDVSATGTTTAGQVRFFLHDGSALHPYGTPVTVTAAVPSATVAQFSTTWYPPGNGLVKIPTGWALKAATYNSEGFSLVAKGGDY
jgi:hypothetical protein